MDRIDDQDEALPEGVRELMAEADHAPRLTVVFAEYFEQVVLEQSYTDEDEPDGEDLPGTDEDDGNEDKDVPSALREACRSRARILTGALWRGCAMLIEDLFEDLGAADVGEEHDFDSAIFELPPRFSPHYDVGFIRRFLTVAVDLGHQLRSGGQVPQETDSVDMAFGHDGKVSCVAQELALHLVLNRVEVLNDLYELNLEDGWREAVYEILFYDDDYVMLFDRSMDGFEDDAALVSLTGMTDMRLEHWFTPFNPMATVNPYAAGEPVTPEDEGDSDIVEELLYEETSWATDETTKALWLIRPDDVETLRVIHPENFHATVHEVSQDHPFLTLGDVLHAALRKLGVHSKAPPAEPPHTPVEPGWLLFEIELTDPARSRQL
ncbi:hypothetical protein GCM10011374_36510 [Kocuria dechangensis]|uniref:Uncharacterized protein n=1 Tax=Kocuria dechangensis TaxID=1176249 RepID=A0A917H6D6_9MICC|nr:hypothetical protein [Kocuria dechangensis]GGG68801.1 hypothetical protein GCM10011374_36510 [Kocuria dechangensis]